VEIVIKLDEQNPEIIGDGEKLKQVFINLIFNAVQAMPAGGKLQIATGAEEGKVFISFTDNGEGINPLHLDKLFDPFFTTRDKGTGLGLAIVHQIIELHEGNIEVTSIPAQGSVFKVILKKNRTGEV
jgi:signal transduction histidine kinase